LAFAIQSLHKGLAINKDHLLCLFTHGVLMFKLGLLTQAYLDFLRIVELYPEEPMGHYNYALTCLQLNEIEEAYSAVDDALTGKGCALTLEDDPDHIELMHDAHRLKAWCLWRLQKPLEAVKSFEMSKRFKAKLLGKPAAKLTSKELEE